ncbi:hypothetical protein HPB50_023642 [Hyalomma asiaticum]|uniref:Uncharacterized protein n=1 Tax=Hyalomma asiaticum TaxID=266040 RepID=A0ACB7T3T8_HYAAI|nr:hypothetical protein HPB50_023642 [Hyalomma asiaticum]
MTLPTLVRKVRGQRPSHRSSCALPPAATQPTLAHAREPQPPISINGRGSRGDKTRDMPRSSAFKMPALSGRVRPGHRKQVLLRGKFVQHCKS